LEPAVVSKSFTQKKRIFESTDRKEKSSTLLL